MSGHINQLLVTQQERLDQQKRNHKLGAQKHKSHAQTMIDKATIDALVTTSLWRGQMLHNKKEKAESTEPAEDGVNTASVENGRSPTAEKPKPKSRRGSLTFVSDLKDTPQRVPFFLFSF